MNLKLDLPSQKNLFSLFITLLVGFSFSLSIICLQFFPSVMCSFCLFGLGPEALPYETEFSMVLLVKEEKQLNEMSLEQKTRY